jgi:mannose-6-phosphate isomerase-like protein (cupin superfamily)
MEAIDLTEKFGRIGEAFQPKVLASLNGQEVRAVLVKGVFPWHRHEGVSELFLVFRGQLRVEFRTHIVELGPGQMTVVPPGVEHRTAADEEAWVLIFEPAEVVNTGDAPASAFTAPNGVRL